MSTFKKLVIALLLNMISATAFAITNAQVFAYAEANYPNLFSGAATAGTYQTYNYQYYPANQNYLAVDTTGMIYMMGASTGGALTPVGAVSSFADLIAAWEAQASPLTSTAGIGVRPSIGWSVSPSPAIYTYVMQLCYGAQCTSLGGAVLVDVNPNDTITVSGTANGISFGGLTRDELQAVIDAATTELNTLISNLWTGTSTPSSAVMESVFNTALASATSPEEVISGVISGFTAAGFPAVAGSAAGGSTTGTAVGTGDAAACSSQAYQGGIGDPQFDSFCQIAQLDACLYTATGNASYLTDKNNQCAVLDGLLQSVGSTWSCRYCP